MTKDLETLAKDVERVCKEWNIDPDIELPGTDYADMLALFRAYDAMKADRDNWKASRIKYQSIVYSACVEIEKAFGRRRGEVTITTDELIDTIKKLRADRDAERARRIEYEKELMR